MVSSLGYGIAMKFTLSGKAGGVEIFLNDLSCSIKTASQFLTDY